VYLAAIAIIDKADEDLGMVTGTKYSGYQVRMTVIVRARGETQLAVRASALYNDKAIEEPLPYQDFFTALEKSLFLSPSGGLAPIARSECRRPIGLDKFSPFAACNEA
jgi:hypothetical protein